VLDAVRVVALETTERVGSVAALCDDNMLLELGLNPQQRSAQSLAPAIGKLLQQAGWRPSDVDLVAVTAGPGSFTGLRVGVTTAKALAYSMGADILGVDTLETVAAGVPPDVQNLSVAVDAQRGQVVAGSFRRGRDGWFAPQSAAGLIGADAWLAGLGPEVVVAGPVLRKLADRLPAHVTVLDPRYWPPRAASVARLAARLHAAGRRDDVWSLAPRYSRPSAAEEKWQRRK